MLAAWQFAGSGHAPARRPPPHSRLPVVQLVAAVLWSGQTRIQARQVLDDVAAGRIKVLFVSPERLNNPHLLAALAPRMPLPLVVVDEAHCVAGEGRHLPAAQPLHEQLAVL